VSAPCHAGTLSGKGVRNCYSDRALTDATGKCDQLLAELRNKNDYAKYCDSCGGESDGKSVWLIGNIISSNVGGSCGLTGCSPRECFFSASYGCCIDTGNFPRATGPPSSRQDDNLKLTGSEACACTQTNTNPLTGQSISCTCYFQDQSAAKNCPGARYGASSQRWYKDC
jgi:hypothetical protein